MWENDVKEGEILDRFQETKGLRLIRDSERKEKIFHLSEKEHVPCLTLPKLSNCEGVEHLFSIRAGGVSEDMFRSMNFSVRLGDRPDRVLENYGRVSKAFGLGLENMVGTYQTHTTNIRRVDGSDGGKGIVKPTDYQDVDGLVTNERDLILCAYAADCVPLLFADCERHAIGIAHSGWRGTVGNMAGKMVERMQMEFHSDPKKLIVGIGPCICRSCYEVDEKVAEQFRILLGDNGKERTLIAETDVYPMKVNGRLRKALEPREEEGKYLLDLWLANLILLIRAGVLPENVDVTDICTACNPGILFSHRASKGRRGNLGAFICLK